MSFNIPAEISGPLMSLISAVLAYFLGHRVGTSKDK